MTERGCRHTPAASNPNQYPVLKEKSLMRVNVRSAMNVLL